MQMLKLFALFVFFMSVTLVGQSKGDSDANGTKIPLAEGPKTEIGANFNVMESVIFQENFDSYNNGDLTFGGWVNYDGDGAVIGGITGFTFPHQGEAIGWTVVNWSASTTIAAHSGTNTVAPMYNTNAAANNDWLISPKIYLSNSLTNAYLSFWTYILTTQYGPENISVYVSNDPNAVTPAQFPATALQSYVLNTAVTWEQKTIGLSSFIGDTVRIAIRYHSTDVFTVLVDDFEVGTLAGPGVATNPSPANAATGVALSPTLTWANPDGTTNVEVFFGTSAGSLTSVYNGAAVTTFNTATLAYNTTYYWRVNPSNASGTSVGDIWSFTTLPDPNDPTVLYETFEGATFPPTNWTLESTVGTTQYWTRQTTASGYGTGTASSRYAFYSSSSGNTQSMITPTLPLDAGGQLLFDHAYATYTDGANDQLQIEYSTDGGTSWTTLVLLNGGNSGELVTAPGQSGAFTPTAGQWASKVYNLPVGTNKVKFKAISAFGNNLWLDNIKVLNIIPVELTSFNVKADGNSANLTWSTATETNNKGFSVERKSGESFETVAFVNGYGTTTASKNYSFTDEGLNSGTVTYRLKQIDFDGTFEYSKEVEVEIAVPDQYSLNQNYPNPFNPVTKIEFSLATESKVTMKIFNTLGEEVVTLVNNVMPAGQHNVNFEASKLHSGVYFYSIEATGSNGVNFTSVKKMVLMK